MIKVFEFYFRSILTSEALMVYYYRHSDVKVLGGFLSSEALVIFKLKVFILDFVIRGTNGIEIQTMRD